MGTFGTIGCIAGACSLASTFLRLIDALDHPQH